ncbi:mechanosensitive ion channel family protein [Tellurirhabdus bombi]|uniref:mechanosensitive ion channel family protein n=1 Tax=Tellurirhabdus bombi TaxID=2907205 RepID=UPI001F390B0D|nr:mechanosensitive ion channel family protein [Tellurirhabdus bombi]
MQTLEQWFSPQILENSIGTILLFSGLILAVTLLKKHVSTILSKTFYGLMRSKTSAVPLSEFIRLVRKPIEILLLLVVVYIAFSLLSIPSTWEWPPITQFGTRQIVARLYQTIIMLVLIWLGVRTIKFFALIFQRRAELTETKLDDQLVPFLRDLIILSVCIIGGFATLGLVYGVNVIGLVTGLGIGGLAIALAARETLENLFASFAILLDRPFVTGDTVTAGTGVNQVTGTVEKIGFRSTRLRTDEGSLIAVPNRLMVSQSLDNLTERRQRRAKFPLRLALDTPPETLQRIVEEIRQLFADHPMTNANPALILFDSFNESSLDILIQYYVSTADWREFNRIKEEMNYRLINIVHHNNGQLAFPTRMLYLRNQSEHPLEQ